jgi:hypothetical protein
LSFLIKYQGGTAQVRFQPSIGELLAAATENIVSVFDVETDRRMHTLQVTYISLTEIINLLPNQSGLKPEVTVEEVGYLIFI